jgi:hypothetical protein
MSPARSPPKSARSSRSAGEKGVRGTYGQRHRYHPTPDGSRHGARPLRQPADAGNVRPGARRRQRQPAGSPHRLARETGGAVRRQVPDHRLHAVELRQLGHTAHRHRDPVQIAQPHPPRPARLELPGRPVRRVHPAPPGPAADRGKLVRGHRRCRVPELGRAAPACAAFRPRARRRSRVQDGLRADAGGARAHGSGRHGRLRRSPGRRGRARSRCDVDRRRAARDRFR